MRGIIFALLPIVVLAKWPSDKCNQSSSYITCKSLVNPDDLQIPSDGIVLTFDACYIPVYSFNVVTNPSSLNGLLITNSRVRTIEKGTFINYSQLSELHMSFNNITEIQRNTFIGCGNVGDFNLSHNNLLSLEKDAFMGLTGVRSIDLSFNRIKSVKAGVLNALNNVESLYLQHNDISSVQPGVFDDLSALRQLDLSYNNLTDLGEVFVNNTNLGTLNLAFNQIESIDGYMERSIEHFNASYNKILAVNLNVSEKTIDLSHNNIVNINIVAYGSIIDLSHNNLTQLYSQQINMSYNGALDLSYNNINELSESAFEDSNLDVLNLSHNNLSSFSQNANRISNLNLAFNRIDLNSEYFINLTGSTLNLSYNVITELIAENFKHTLNVAVLDLSRNYIEEIPIGFFAQQSVLTSLDLSHNLLSEIRVGTFIGLHALNELNLSHNRIKFLSEIAFDNTPNLHTLNITWNYITTLSNAQLSPLSTCDFNRNRITCLNLHELLSLSCIVLGYETEQNIRGIYCVDDENLHGEVMKVEQNFLITNVVEADNSDAPDLIVMSLMLLTCMLSVLLIIKSYNSVRERKF